MNQTKKKCIKVYVSGKITGLTKMEAELNFEEASKKIEKYLRNAGFDQIAIFNPMQKPGSFDGVSYEDCMEIDFMFINKCNAIFLMRNWKQSKGAKMELNYARFMNKIVFYEWDNGSINLDLDTRDKYISLKKWPLI